MEMGTASRRHKSPLPSTNHIPPRTSARSLPSSALLSSLVVQQPDPIKICPRPIAFSLHPSSPSPISSLFVSFRSLNSNSVTSPHPAPPPPETPLPLSYRRDVTPVTPLPLPPPAP